MARPGRPRRDPLPDVTGADLCVELYGGLSLYGFACPAHGLRYVMQAHPGDAMTIDNAEPVRNAKPPDPVGRGIQCDVCAESMAYTGRHGRARTAPGDALADLQRKAATIMEQLRKGGE